MEWFLYANDGVVLMLFAMATALACFAVVAMSGREESTHWWSVGWATAAALAAGVAWFQWRYHITAIMISGVLSLAMLLATLFSVIAIGLRHVIDRQQPMTPWLVAAELVAFIIGITAISVWIYAISLPLQVAVRAWTWHRQGIDLGEIRSEIRRRA